MNSKILFLVDKVKLSFFCNFLKIPESGCFGVANRQLTVIKKNWQKNELFIEKLFFGIFGKDLKKEIKVFIFPRHFYLGATETIDQIVLFGQPLRTRNFSSAIIAHEAAHIYLSKCKIKRPKIVDEIICLMIEDYIYSVLDKKTLFEVWTEKELDRFHLIAMKEARKEIEKNGAIVNRKLFDVIKKIKNTLSSDIIRLNPEKGLIKNISRNRNF